MIGREERPAGRPPWIDALPPELVLDPLNWLFAEHYRHRQLCQLIERVGTAAVFLREEAQTIVDFLSHDMVLHVIDEEDDLFPLLRRRCLPTDELDAVLGTLSAEHRDDLNHAQALIALLQKALADGEAPGQGPETRRLFTEFTLRERRHIALENAVVLPIARLRLRAPDLRSLSLRLAARRGVVLEKIAGEVTQ